MYHCLVICLSLYRLPNNGEFKAVYYRTKCNEQSLNGRLLVTCAARDGAGCVGRTDMVRAWHCHWWCISRHDIPRLSAVDDHIALHGPFVVQRSWLPVAEDVGFFAAVAVIVRVGGTEARRTAHSLPVDVAAAAAAACTARIRHVLATWLSPTERIRSTSFQLGLIRQCL